MNNVVLVEVRRGADGRLYPARPHTQDELARLRGLAHALHCRDHLSVRAVQRTLAESYGQRRSVGVIWRDLTRFSCGLPACPAVPAPDPPQRPPEPPRAAAAVHQAPGGLTGMVRDG